VIIGLPNHTLVSNDAEIIDMQQDCVDDYAVILLIMEHEQSSFQT
jgi:hypothetical protein